IEVAKWEHHTIGLDALQDIMILVIDGDGADTQLATRLQSGLASAQLPHADIVGHNVAVVVVRLVAEQLGVEGEPLSAVLFVVNQANLVAVPLDEPDAHGVIDPEVPPSLSPKRRVVGDAANALVLVSLLNLLRVVGDHARGG